MNNYPNLLAIYEDSTEYLVADPSLRIEGYWQRSITESFDSMQLDADDYYDRPSRGYTVSYMYKGTKLTVKQAQTQSMPQPKTTSSALAHVYLSPFAYTK